MVFSVSSASIASTARPWRCEPSRIDSLVYLASGACASRPTSTTSGIVTSGTSASGPATTPITAMNSSTKGKSTSASSEALVMKSRTDSKSRRLLAYEPDEAGFCAKSIASTRLNSAALMIRSAFLPATSVSRARTMRAANSNTLASSTPSDSTHSVSYALLGITRSYTFIT